MRKIVLLTIVSVIALTVFYSCEKTAKNEAAEASAKMEDGATAKPPVGTNNCYDFQITMTRTYADGQTTFIWKIVNPKPGNGKNGTQQDLSHWAFKPQCVGGEDLNYHPQDILAAYYSYNNDYSWNQIIPTPKMKADPSSSCMSPEEHVFKFDFGTSGSKPTYYKLVLAGNWAAAGDGGNGGFVKAGLACCRLSGIPGVGCKQD